MKVGVLGAGFTGLRLCRRLVEAGHDVRGARRSSSGLQQVAEVGAAGFAVDLDSGAGLEAFTSGLDTLVHLVPPPDAAGIEAQIERMRPCLPERVVYGSTTGVFGRVEGWIDETTEPGLRGERGERRYLYERALRGTDRSVRVVRIPGIYGPGRTLDRSLARGMLLFEDGPFTSRIHVDDLARGLEAMLEPEAPELLLCCDEEPAPTLDVARYTLSLLGRPLPEVVSKQEASERLSPTALEMRMSGRRCRSVRRADLMGDLTYPTYREGVRASLIAAGQDVIQN